MTRDEAIELMRDYARHSAVMEAAPEITAMYSRWPSDGSSNKAMRWLGYMQGFLVARGVFDLDEVKEHSRTREVL